MNAPRPHTTRNLYPHFPQPPPAHVKMHLAVLALEPLFYSSR